MVSNIFYFHPYLGKLIQFDEHIFRVEPTNQIWTVYMPPMLARRHSLPSFQVGNVSVMMENFDLPVEFRGLAQSTKKRVVRCFPIPYLKAPWKPTYLLKIDGWKRRFLEINVTFSRGQGGGWGCTYIYHKFQPNLGKYSSPMGHMGYGYGLECTKWWMVISQLLTFFGIEIIHLGRV